MAASGAAASLEATTVNLTPSGDLQATLNASQAGDVINLAAGTYIVKTGEPYFHIDVGLTLQGTAGSVQTILQAPSGAAFGLDIRTGNATVKGITVSGGGFGVSIGVTGTPTSNITLFDVVANSIPSSANPGHGINLGNVSNVIIDTCNIGQAYANGINVVAGSNNVIIRNTEIHGTVTTAGIFVQNSSGIQISNTTITSAATSGILLQAAPNATVTGVTIGTVGQHGIYVLDSDAVTVSNSSVASAGNSTTGGNGITVQAVTETLVNSPVLFNNTVALASYQGILFSAVSHGTIDSCTIVHAQQNGIFLDAASVNNLVINNTVTQADVHGMVNKLSNSNTWAGNRVLQTGFHGMELIGASYNRVDRNNLSGFFVDGITITLGDDSNQTQSVSNYVGTNIVTSNGNAAGRTNGTGIWLNLKSNNTFVFGNTESGDVEGGISSFNSSNSYIRANVLSGNGQAGFLIWNSDASQPNPKYTTIQNNYVFNNPPSGLDIMRGAQYNDIGYNFLVGTGATGAGADPGITLITWTGSGQVGGTSGPSTNSTIYRNTFLNLKSATGVGPDVTSTLVFGLVRGICG